MNQQQINLLIQLKNAAACFKALISVSNLKKNFDLITFLYDEGIIESFKITHKRIFVFLKKTSYNDLVNFKIQSKPLFLSYRSICSLRLERGNFAILTNKGVQNLSNSKRLKLGGKLLFIY